MARIALYVTINTEMSYMKTQLTVIIVLLLIPLGIVFSEENTFSYSNYEDILAFVNKNNLQFSWDSTYDIGIIRKGGTYVNFQPARPYVLINFKDVVFIDPVIKYKDSLLASKKLISLISKIFADEPERLPLQSQYDNTNVDSTKKQPSISSQKKKELFKSTGAFSNIVVIVLDPGHGGKDPGTIGEFVYKKKSYRLLEKTIVLNVSKKIQSLLQKQFPQVKIVITRKTDQYISLEERILIANNHLQKLKENQAILFVSIHANGVPTKEPNGYEVWYLPPEYKRNLISKDLGTNKQIYSIINSIRQEEIVLESVELAKNVIKGMSLEIRSRFTNRGIKEEEWYVVRNAKMPAILVELGFITNPKEGAAMATEKYQNLLAKGIAKGIINYMELFDVSNIQ